MRPGVDLRVEARGIAVLHALDIRLHQPFEPAPKETTITTQVQETASEKWKQTWATGYWPETRNMRLTPERLVYGRDTASAEPCGYTGKWPVNRTRRPQTLPQISKNINQSAS